MLTPIKFRIASCGIKYWLGIMDRKANRKLYIIGNGFDLHHGLKSSYYDFAQFLRRSDHELYEHVQTFIPVENLWSEFEQNLAAIDVDTIRENAGDFLTSYGAEGWSDSNHHSYQNEIENITSKLSKDLRNEFYEWIINVNENVTNTKKLSIDTTQLFLSFNYTSTLQKLYQIDKNKILFIHGNCENTVENIVLGHDFNSHEAEELSSRVTLEDEDTRVVEGEAIIKKYFEDTFKPSAHLIKKNEFFFRSLFCISEIVVLGHSLGEVDRLYFEKIAQCAPYATWKISCYGETPSAQQQKMIKDLDVQSFFYSWRE